MPEVDHKYIYELELHRRQAKLTYTNSIHCSSEEFNCFKEHWLIIHQPLNRKRLCYDRIVLKQFTRAVNNIKEQPALYDSEESLVSADGWSQTIGPRHSTRSIIRRVFGELSIPHRPTVPG